jgi:SAM-dependent methyltransferase
MPISISFRDPDGSVQCSGNRIIRTVLAARLSEFTTFLKSSTAQTLIANGHLVGTRELPDDLSSGRQFEHDRVWFPSYPYEWPPEMLFEAGSLTLDLAEAALEEGYGLKDATPFNILFNGPNPVFVDVLSFEPRMPADSIWLPYAQFWRMFILPLLAHKHFGSRAHELLSVRPHGLEPEELYARCSWAQRIRPPFLGALSIPTWLGRKTSLGDVTPKPRRKRKRPQTEPPKVAFFSNGHDPDQARFILQMQFRRLRKALRAVEPKSGRKKSIWSGYASMMSYSSEEFDNKRQIVWRWLLGSIAKTVLDIGCNTGAFSEIAARLNADVVAVDSDPVVVGRVWKLARRERLNVLPLVVDFARPTPATGWRNAENSGFLDRAAGRFDTVLMLAVLHHLLVTERIPLSEVLDLAAHLSRKELIIEYVDREDPMFQQLLRGRGDLHTGFTREFFENTCQQRFTIVGKQSLKSDLRILYLLRKK